MTDLFSDADDPAFDRLQQRIKRATADPLRAVIGEAVRATESFFHHHPDRVRNAAERRWAAQMLERNGRL